MNLINVTKVYHIKDNLPVYALKDISISLPSKGMVFFVGKSGSGKSTLLNLLGGLDRPTSGTIDVHGSNIASLTSHELDVYRSKHIGFIFQDLNLIETLTVKENISLSFELNGISCDDEMIENALITVDLKGYSNRMPNTLSGGQRQRVAIARALIKSPEIILADEPTGSLDSETSLQILQLLKKLTQKNLVIIVSHDLEFAKLYGDRIIELKDGVIMSDTNDSYVNELLIRQEENHSFNTSNHLSLPIKRSIQLAYHYLKLKKWKLMLSMVISLATFVLFGLFDALGSYEITNNSLESMYQSNQTNVYINKFIQFEDDINGTSIHMSFNDITDFENQYPNSLFVPIMSEYNINYLDSLFDYVSIDSNLYFTQSQGGIAITEEIMNQLGFDYVYGDLPINTNQVLITLHTFHMFKNYDYRTQDDQEIEINNYEDIIGLNFYLDDKSFEIVGILDTHLDLSKFDRLFDGTDLSTIEKISLLYQYNGQMESGIHQNIFMHEDVLEIYKDTYSNMVNLALTGTYTTMSFQTTSDLVNGYMLGYFAKMTLTHQPNSIIWLDHEISTLSEHQVILPSYAITSNLSHSQEISVLFNQLIDTFVVEHFSEIEIEFEANETGSYSNFIRTSSVNPYHPGYTVYYFYHEALEMWIHNNYDDIQVGLMEITGHIDQIHDIEIVGFYEDILSNNQYAVYTSELLYEQVVDTHLFYPLYGAVAVLSGNHDEDQSLIDEITHVEEEFYFNGTNPILTTAIIYDKVLSDFSSIFLYIGIVLALLSTLQLFNLIASSISMKKKEIGILRAIGARIQDVIKIFYSEALMIGIISAVCALLLNAILIAGANRFFMIHYGTPVKLLIFGYRQVLIILSFVLISATLSTILPVYFYAKKNPIDTIRS